MSAFVDIQEAIEGMLAQPGALSVAVPLAKRRPKALAAQIEEALASQGLGIFVMPPIPLEALRNVPFVFFKSFEIRLRIVEKPSINQAGIDAYDLWDELAALLQWQPHRGLLAAVQARQAAQPSESDAEALAWVKAQAQYAPLVALGNVLTSHPMQLRSRCCEEVEDRVSRIRDIIFDAPLGLSST